MEDAEGAGRPHAAVAAQQRERRRYDAGVGTNFFKFTGGAFGVGISKNIRDLYSFIVRNRFRT